LQVILSTVKCENIFIVRQTYGKFGEETMTHLTAHGSSIFRAGTIFAQALALLALAGPAVASTTPGAPLIFAGSGTNLPIVRALSQGFQRSHPAIAIDVPASIGSGGGIQAAADGAIALGLISRELKDKEKGKGLTVVNYAWTPLIIGVHPSVAEDNISHAELLDIYRGKKRTWRDGRDIVVLTREPSDSSIEVLVKGVPGFGEVYEESQQARRWTTLLKDLVMNETLARTPHAIGVSDLGSLIIERHAIKPLKVNGVAPTLKNLQNGRYPLYKTLAFVYRQDRLPAGARLFMDYVRSKEGEKILKVNGYLPAK
jgi:phosphate transport system substrate-binding protein